MGEQGQLDLENVAAPRRPGRAYRSPYPGGLPGHSSRDTASKAAAAAVLRSVTGLQRLVLDAVRKAGVDGATVVDLVNDGMGYRYTLAPRLTELHKLGLIEKHGTRPVAELCRKCKEPTHSAHASTVWRLIGWKGGGQREEIREPSTTVARPGAANAVDSQSV